METPGAHCYARNRAPILALLRDRFAERRISWLHRPRLDAPTLPIYSAGKALQLEIANMFVKITAKRQVTFPARVLEALGVKPGDRIELEEGPDGFVLRARHIDRSRLAPLRGKLRRGIGTFDLEAFRNKPHARALRD